MSVDYVVEEPTLSEWLADARVKCGNDRDKVRDFMLKELDKGNVVEWKRIIEMFDFWFYRAYRPSLSVVDRSSRVERDKMLKDAVRRKIAERDNRIRVEAKIEFLSLLMPNGKLLGECTFGELSQFTSTYRSFLERLSRVGRAKQKIKTVCSEAQLLQLWNTGGENNIQQSVEP